MSKKLLLGIVVVLLITNLASLLVLNNKDSVVLNDNDDRSISSNEAVASIGSEEISYQQWIEALRSDYGETQLKQMVDRAVVNQLAEAEGIGIEEKLIDRDVAFLITMQGVMTEEQAAKEEERLRDEVIYRYQLQQLLAADASIPEEEVKSFYDSYGNQYNFTASLQLSHILVEDTETAEKVYDELEQGASFDLLAEEYSLDDETKDVGGYLGYIYTSSQFLPSIYEDVASEMDEHSYSEPFTADNGVAILYLHRQLPSIELTYDELKPYMESELALQEMDQSLTAAPLWEQLDVEWIYSE
ncbi:peptidylprolyl isomerase [Oceanobacillus polygoni]|uniref:peptidylprolyl isomerase n=1 Tax=Oceanobacillus polygoni TaxID=1235259 RepID=A0A9X0YWN9_9BACI|nr:peptidyl-prolyl cis-trans isomerase [Oceanobacillus polygoni]MBP2078509.1 foldase protein PrsA [Oceanobacillus polygoni]